MKIRLNKESSADSGSDADKRAPSNYWKWALAGVALLVAVALTSTRKPPQPPLPNGGVAFKNSGIALIPGPGWRVIQSGGYTHVRNISLPVLEGTGQQKGSMLEVLASPDFPKDPHEMAKNLIAGLQNDTNVVKGSVMEEEFVAKGGLRGEHVSCRIAVQDLDRKGQVAAHCYLVTNAEGKCVRINLTTSPGLDSTAAHEMIRDTLMAW